MLIDHHFTPWWILVPCGIAIGLAHRDRNLRHWTLLLVCMGVSYFLVISGAATKLEWYEAPLFPVLAALAAIPLHFVFQWLGQASWPRALVHPGALQGAALFLLFIRPYSSMVDKMYLPVEYSWNTEFYRGAHYLQTASKGGPLDVDVILHEGYDAYLRFYAMLLQEQGSNVAFVRKDELKLGMRVLVDQAEVGQYLVSTKQVRVIRQEGALGIYEILTPDEAAP
jgi:hypothetical protein